MAYTPTTWVTGDKITATAMNKIENGIASAGGVATIRLSASGFPSSTTEFGNIVYAYRDNEQWIVYSDSNGDWQSIWGIEVPNEKLVNMLIPSDTDVGAFILTNHGVTVTGGISEYPTPMYFSFGSVVDYNAYRVTGNGTIQFVAT